MGASAPVTSPVSRHVRTLGLGRFGQWAIPLYASVVLLLGWSYSAWHIQNDRAATLEASQLQLATLAKSMASQFEAMVADGVGAAVAGADVLRGTDAMAGRQRLLASMLTGGAYVRALFVVVTGARPVIATRAEVFTEEQMPWLEELRSARGDAWVGRVQRRDSHLLLPIARRVPGTTEWAGAFIQISDLGPVYADLLQSHATVSLVHESGRLITQIPRDIIDPVNYDLSGSPIYQMYQRQPRQPLMTLNGPHPITGKERQYIASQVAGMPVFATSGRNVEDALAAWSVRRSSSLQFMGAATLVVYALAIALQSAMNRRFMALQKSEERFQLVAAATHDGLFEWESGSGRVYFTPRAMELLQRPDTAEMPQIEGLREWIHPDDLTAAITAFRRHIDARSPLDLEARLRAGDSWRWFRIRGQAEWNAAGEPERLAGSIGDIHDTVTAQEKVAEARRAELAAKESLARQLLGAQEQERKRLASELHDGIGQNLSLLRNRAVMLQRAGVPAASATHVQALLDLATESIEDLRRVAQNLRPLHLEELGVVTALRALLDRVATGSDLAVSRRLEDIDDVIRGAAATHVYRIAQEAINNTLKHSGARNLWFEAIRDIDCVVLRIRDDGRGMPAAPGAESGGLGIMSIRERCNILRAKLQVESSERAGTTITVRIPIDTGPELIEDEQSGEVHV
jgi:signal transduction histidine kinase